MQDISEVMKAPDSEDMPAFAHIPEQDRLTVGAYILRLIDEATKAGK